MRGFHLIAATICLTTAVLTAAEGDPGGFRIPEELLRRGIVAEGDVTPLHRALAKASQGGSFTVGILGGSITQGAKASRKELHYSGHVMQWWKSQFPNTRFQLVNAGIGATNSMYGALRAERDLLSTNPDLIIVEYAVNDGATQEFAESYEGVLRQILARPGPPALLLLFMMNEKGGNAQEWQSKLGTHYGLPMVSYRDLLWPEIEAKRLTWPQISPDTVHPNDLGHAYTGKLLCALFDRAVATRPQALREASKPLPAPLLTDCFQFTQLREAGTLEPIANQGWERDAAQASNPCWKSTKPGSTIEFEMPGERLFFSYWRIRGPLGQARVTVDDGAPVMFDAWFEQTWGGYRDMKMLLRDQPGKHRVRIELVAERNPQSSGNEFRILCLGAAGRAK